MLGYKPDTLQHNDQILAGMSGMSDPNMVQLISLTFRASQNKHQGLKTQAKNTRALPCFANLTHSCSAG